MDTLATALENARNLVYEAFETLADRTDVPDHVIHSIQAAYRAIREMEADQ
jgi:hypothetical protein